MAFGGSFGIGAAGDVQEFVLWGFEVSAGGITALDDDTTTAFAKGLAALPAGADINVRLRDYLNTQYGTSNTDIQPLVARYLKDIKS